MGHARCDRSRLKATEEIRRRCMNARARRDLYANIVSRKKSALIVVRLKGWMSAVLPSVEVNQPHHKEAVS